MDRVKFCTSISLLVVEGDCHMLHIIAALNLALLSPGDFQSLFTLNANFTEHGRMRQESIWMSHFLLFLLNISPLVRSNSTERQHRCPRRK
jgi:hypothetical protein